MTGTISPGGIGRESNKNMKICIIGAGLAGSMMAILLGKLGYKVTVYEKREDPKAVTPSSSSSSFLISKY